jgi:hypothetical protein
MTDSASMTGQTHPTQPSNGEAREPLAPAAGTAIAESPAPTPDAPAGEERQVPDVVSAACRFAAARRRPAAIFILAEGDPVEGTADVPITVSAVTQFASAVGADSRFDELDLVIQSSGGDIHAAYRMMSFLRRRITGTKKPGLFTCVPRKAQSSATLLCLGGDQIMLDELAALGPLDAQIRIGVTDVGTPDYTSALHLLKGLTRLRDFSLETLSQAAAVLYDKRVRRSDDIVRYSIEFSRGITAPLFERIESHRIGYWDQMLRTGEAYGQRLLEGGDLIWDARDMEKPEHIRHVIHKLVNDYPSHEYVIDCDELVKNLHLKAALFEGEQQAAARELAKCVSDTLMMVVYPPEVAGPAELAGAPERTLRDWNAFGANGAVETVKWVAKGLGTFLMRVGLYHRPLKSSRNPWREGGTSPDGAPSEQYFAAPGPGW